MCGMFVSFRNCNPCPATADLKKSVDVLNKHVFARLSSHRGIFYILLISELQVLGPFQHDIIYFFLIQMNRHDGRTPQHYAKKEKKALWNVFAHRDKLVFQAWATDKQWSLKRLKQKIKSIQRLKKGIHSVAAAVLFRFHTQAVLSVESL